MAEGGGVVVAGLPNSQIVGKMYLVVYFEKPFSSPLSFIDVKLFVL